MYSAGDQSPVFTVGGLSFGIMICNDWNFPALATDMVARGARAIFVPSNNSLPADRADVVAVSRAVDIARARDNGVMIVRADVAGRTADPVVRLVRHCRCARNGSRAGAALREDILVADVDRVAKARSYAALRPCARRRRPVSRDGRRGGSVRPRSRCRRYRGEHRRFLRRDQRRRADRARRERCDQRGCVRQRPLRANDFGGSLDETALLRASAGNDRAGSILLRAAVHSRSRLPWRATASNTSDQAMLSAGAAHTVNATRPPGLSTRLHSASAASGRGTW